MRRAQVVQIILLLAAIFAAGVATGWLTAPRGPTYVKDARGRYVTSETKLEQMTRQLDLDENQKEQFRVLLEDVAQEIAKYPPLSQERLQVLRDSLPKQRAVLRPDQQQALEEMARQTERRFEQMRRRQAATNESRIR